MSIRYTLEEIYEKASDTYWEKIAPGVECRKGYVNYSAEISDRKKVKFDVGFNFLDKTINTTRDIRVNFESKVDSDEGWYLDYSLSSVDNIWKFVYAVIILQRHINVGANPLVERLVSFCPEIRDAASETMKKQVEDYREEISELKDKIEEIKEKNKNEFKNIKKFKESFKSLKSSVNN